MRRKKKQSWFNVKNVVSMFFVLLMASSILAIWQGTGSSGSAGLEPYNDYDITVDDGTYLIETDLGDVRGYSYPAYLETITLEAWQLAAVQESAHITVLFDPQDEAVAYVDVLRSYLASTDLPGLGKSVSFAIVQEDETYAYEVLDCASAPMGTIYLRTAAAAPTTITLEDNCLVLEGASGQDLVYAKDRLVYTLYGIME